ncbi:protein phosphatase 1 regulatory subunit 21 [Anabrus simplex]|uniref:protein phosphatase 1 regulatory subunit 21 n=1 Tax=Anabrus simplex TaxID=316456 RepID=UPI0035A2DC8C
MNKDGGRYITDVKVIPSESMDSDHILLLIRAQANVLKKAILEEQTRNAELRDLLREREQSLRKADQEIDSLTFRNQLLTKRVTVLQEELDSAQTRHRKGKSKGADAQQSSDVNNHVIDEEFHKKIAENARLLSLIHDKDMAHEQEVAALKQQLQNLEHELHQHHAVNSDAEHKYKAVIDKLEEEKTELAHSAETQSLALEQCTSDLAALKQQHSQMQGELGSQLESARSIIAHHLPFVDSYNSELNELNIPLHDRKQQIYCLHVIAQAGLHVKDVTAALSDFHTYTEERLHCTAAPGATLSPANARFSSHLKENARYLRALEQGYSEFQAGVESEGLTTLETLPSLQKMGVQLAAYTNYLCKLRQYQHLSMEEENMLSTCTGSLEAMNTEVLQNITNITNLFMKLNTYVQLLCAQSKRTCQHPPSSQRRFLLEVTQVLRELHDTMKDLFRSYSTKSRLEHELPTSSERLLTADECLVKSLSSLVAAVSKLSGVLSDSRAELWKTIGPPKTLSGLRSRTHPAVSSFKKRAASYLNYLDQDESPSVPYDEALREREEMRSSAVSQESLTEQLASCRQRATKLEQDKEHWRLEYQLLQLRHCKRLKDLEEQLQSLSGSSTPQGDAVSEGEGETAPQGPITITNLLGRLEAPFALTKEMEARELEVKKYFTERINDLVGSRQEAEAKSAALTAECQVLQKRLELSLESKQLCECCLQETQDALARLQEELHTTTHNYETQLSIMSEHLANMNDKLTVQCDEIDQLKYQLTNKPIRKGKQK